MTLTRTGSGSFAFAPPERVDSLAAVRQHLKTVASALPLLETPASTIPNLTTSGGNVALIESLKTSGPAIIKSINSVSKSARMSKEVVVTLERCLDYMASPACMKEIAKEMMGADDFRDMLKELIAEDLDERRSAGNLKVPGERKTRNKELEVRIHWCFHRLCWKKFNDKKTGLVVPSTSEEWPEAGEPEEIDVGEADVQVNRKRWRPDWGRPDDEEAFIEAVVEEFDAKFASDDYDVDMEAIRAGSLKYMSWLAKSEEAGGTIGNKNRRNQVTRSNRLFDMLNSSFVGSILDQCRDRAFYQLAFDTGALFLDTCGPDDAHGLPDESTILPDGLEAGFDGFPLFAEMWLRRPLDEDEDVYVAMDVQWWSTKLKKGYWALFEERRQAQKGRNKNIARRPVFHVSEPFRPVTTLANIPKLAPLTTRARGGGKRAKSGLMELTKSMVTPDIRSAPPFAAWCTGLRNDPIPTEAESNLPTLDELLNSEQFAGVKAAVQRHLAVPRDESEGDMRRLWQLREAGDMDEYRRGLASSDLSTFFVDQPIPEGDGADGP